MLDFNYTNEPGGFEPNAPSGVDRETIAQRVLIFMHASRHLNGSETKVLLNIMVLASSGRMDCMALSLNDLMDLTELSEGAVRRALYALECRGVIRWTQETNRLARTYWVDYVRLGQLGAVQS